MFLYEGKKLEFGSGQVGGLQEKNWLNKWKDPIVAILKWNMQKPLNKWEFGNLEMLFL